jgi:hypothetical protein
MSLLTSTRAALRGKPRTARHGRAGFVAGAVMLALVAPVASVPAPALGASSKPFYFGASGEVDQLARRSGESLGEHVFAQLNGPVRTGRLTNVESNARWAKIASATSGSAIYRDMVRWAKGLKAKGGPIMVSFDHEPEAAADRGLGKPGDFVAAWRKFHRVLVANGARNVQFTWTMTSYSFSAKSGDRRHAANWYPGDAYVDNVASDSYNWYKCGPGRGKWVSLASVAQAPLAFAKAHHKPYVLAEWGSQSGARRAKWLNNAKSWMVDNRSAIRGAFYYQTPRGRNGCHLKLTTSPEFKAFGAMKRSLNAKR